MEAEATIVALAVAGVVTPWVTEIIKKFIGDPSGKKALTVSIIISFLIAGGVLFYQGALNFSDPTAIFASAGLVLGVASAVYQYFKKQVTRPVEIMTTKLLG